MNNESFAVEILEVAHEYCTTADGDTLPQAHLDAWMLIHTYSFRDHDEVVQMFDELQSAHGIYF